MIQLPKSVANYATNFETITLEQYPKGSTHGGSIPTDAIALNFKKIGHLYPINWIAQAIPIDRMMP